MTGDGESDRYEIRSNLTLDDFVDLNEIALGRSRTVIRIVGVLAILIGLAVIPFDQDVLLWLPAVSVGAALLVMTSRPAIAWQIGRKTHGVVGTEVVATVDETGIEATNAGMSARVPWSSITRARSNGRTVVLMRDRVIYAWFSLRTLDPVTHARVLEIIQRQVPDFA